MPDTSYPCSDPARTCTTSNRAVFTSLAVTSPTNTAVAAFGCVQPGGSDVVDGPGDGPVTGTSAPSSGGTVAAAGPATNAPAATVAANATTSRDVRHMTTTLPSGAARRAAGRRGGRRHRSHRRAEVQSPRNVGVRFSAN